MFGSLTPPIGEPFKFHWLPVADDDVKVTVPPHCVIGPAGVNVGVAGNGLMVTVALPLRSEQLLSYTVNHLAVAIV